MTNNTAVEFASALAGEDMKNTDRFKAIVWWYSKKNIPDDATPAQIARDMAEAGYGRQDSTRISNVLKADRKFTKGKGKSYIIKVTARKEYDKMYSKIISETEIAISSVEVSNNVIAMPSPQHLKKVNVNPKLFIGSSAEGLKYARALERQLEHNAEVTIWKDGVFGLGGGTLETLVENLRSFDFAALVLTADDLTYSRKLEQPSPRDNVIFELGLFMGYLGRNRTFIIYNKDDDLKLPSDLAGVTSATFRNRSDGNYHAQLSPPSTLIIDAIEKHGLLR